ncbi:MAG: hypothetical protein LUF27_02345 [Lachnospiraceae bacterium]|nr:hypothetical protein [Lachnospiraceae bacterium]
MAYILSTPTKRSAVVITQAIYMVIMPFLMVGCAFLVKLAATQAFAGEVEVAGFAALYGGLYLLAEAMAAINCACVLCGGYDTVPEKGSAAVTSRFCCE